MSFLDGTDPNSLGPDQDNGFGQSNPGPQNLPAGNVGGLQPQGGTTLTPNAPGAVDANGVALGQNSYTNGGFTAPMAAFGQGGMPGNTSAGANSYAQQLGAMGQGFLAQQGPTLAGTGYGGAVAGDQAGFAAAQGAQSNQLAQLYAQSQGQGPNPAAAQMLAGTQQAQAQQQALAHSAGIGGAGALAARNAATNSATLGTQNANATAQVGAQQQAMATQQYQQLAAQMAQQGQEQQRNAQGLGIGFGQMQQQQQGAGSAAQLAAQQQGMAALTGQLNSDTAIGSAQQGANYGTALAQNAANQSNTNAAVGGTTAAAGALLSLSDARAKDDIRPIGDNLADRFLEHLHPYSFKYKRDEDAPSGPGHYMGVMAQDVERTPTGGTLVANTPRGKAINIPATTGALLAGVGRLHERLKVLEGKSE